MHPLVSNRPVSFKWPAGQVAKYFSESISHLLLPLARKLPDKVFILIDVCSISLSKATFMVSSYDLRALNVGSVFPDRLLLMIRQLC